MARWWLALVGLSLFVFSAVALSGPGRIDIVDGQARYEVARSLVDHGDHAIRDDRVWFGVFPGRGGKRHTYYRWKALQEYPISNGQLRVSELESENGRLKLLVAELALDRRMLREALKKKP